MSSAQPRSSRSRSKTAPDHGDTHDSTSAVLPAAPTPEPLESPEPAAPPASRPQSQGPDKTNNPQNTGGVEPERPATSRSEANGSTLAGDSGAPEVPDDRSSSLSDLGESLEDRDEAILRTQTSPGAEENDSEAETERLDNTPRKLTRTATDLTIRSSEAAQRSPSKLSRVMTTNREGHNAESSRRTFSEKSDGDENRPPSMNDQPMVDQTEQLDGEPRKRKRSSSALSSLGEDLDAEHPDRKRSSSSRNSALNGERAAIELPEQAIEDDEDHTAKEVEGQAEDENGDGQPDYPREPTTEIPATTKAKKGKKGVRKGKKTRATEICDVVADALEEEEPIEGDLELEDVGAMEEDRERKHNALENLNRIEKQFLTFQKRRLDEQLERLATELEQLKQPSSNHSEYLLMLQAVDSRRDEKIRQEDVRLRLKTQILNQQHVATRGSILSQWKHDVGEIRMNSLSDCNQLITHLQRDRRFWGAHETDHAIKFNPKRPEQVKNQSAYNLEVSVLSGIAKYVGFPAAPDLSGARTGELDQDLAAMGISNRSAPYVRPIDEVSRADRAAAEERFFEQTPWANPQHPAHNHGHYHSMAAPQSRVTGNTSNPFATPASQRDRAAVENATNGSASTIDMQSNPPSHGGPTSGQHRDLYESPIMQLKQNLARAEAATSDPHHTASENNPTPVKVTSRPPREEPQLGTTSAHHAPRDVYGGSAFGPSSLMHLTGSSAPPGPDVGAPNPIKGEDAADALQRASAIPQRAGVPVGVAGLFR